ncbi:MAG: hypothetical protein ACTTIV_07760 [Campylobacter sp.]
MKQRDDTKPQALIIDTANLSLKFDDYMLYAMNDKQSQALEYTKDIIKENPSGISRNNLINEIKRELNMMSGSHRLKSRRSRRGAKTRPLRPIPSDLL